MGCGSHSLQSAIVLSTLATSIQHVSSENSGAKVEVEWRSLLFLRQPKYGMRFRSWLENQSQLLQQLMALRPQMAQAAQQIYNSWTVDDDGLDGDVGEGGICDEITNALGNVVSALDVEMLEGGQDGDDHSWLIVHNGREAYGIDIPCQVYERGGGYSWQKIPNVTITPQHVQIFPLNINDITGNY
jgi:hypothetical protein